MSSPLEADVLFKDLESKIDLVSRSLVTSDSKLVLKALRELPPLRKKLTKDVLVRVILAHYAPSDFQQEYLLNLLAYKRAEAESQTPATELSPEVDVFIHLLVQLYFHDTGHLTTLGRLNEKIVALLKSYNKRTLDYLQAKTWFYIQRTCELSDLKNGNFDQLIGVRSYLLAALRTATLKHDDETSASITTLLLRNYLITNDITQAINFVSKVEFPENCGNNLYARYYYYLSKISAVQLNYLTALEYIVNSIRKAPQAKAVHGFVVAATKLKIVIELLMGDIPDLKTFTEKDFARHLLPYKAITKAVRAGDLVQFNAALETHKDAFVRDKTYNLILRLRKNVIKTGIRLISLCYKRISIKDICIKLQMDSEILTEYILNKLIKDHIIEASLNNAESYMSSKELYNIYDSAVPSLEYDKRIVAINALKASFVKEMNYPENKNRFNSKDIVEYEQEMELIRASEDADFDDFI